MKRSFMFSLLVSLILSGGLIAGGVWFYSERISRELVDLNIDSTSRQVAIIIRQYDRIFTSFQAELNLEARKAVLAIAEEVGADYSGWTPARLKELADQYGCDDIYFIDRNGKVVNTSFLPDRRLELFSAGIYFENFIRSIYGKGIVFTPQASVGMRTGILNKYAYYSPVNSDYIVEISYNLRHYISHHYNSSYYEFLSLQKLDELTVDNPLLTHIDLITTVGNERSWSLLNPGREIKLSRSLGHRILRNRRVAVTERDTLTLYIDTTPTPDQFNIYNDDLYITPRTLILTYNLSVVGKSRQELLLFLIAAVMISSIVAFLIVSEYLNRRFLRRVITINHELEKIAGGNYAAAIEVPGRDELATIAGNVNKMAVKIQAREDALQSSERRFRSIFEYAPLGMVILGLDRRVLYCNSAAATMLQYEPEDLEGRGISTLIDRRESEKSIRSFTSAVKGEVKSYVTERRIIRRDGQAILASVTVASIRDDHDLPTQIIAMIDDITEQSQIREQFFRSQKLDAIGKLAGGVAHDFNNLLQVIMGYSRMLEKYLAEPKAVGIWTNIIQAGEKARNLIRQLLALGRSGLTPERKNLVLPPLLHEFVKMLGQVLGEPIKIVLDTEGTIPPILADQGQVEQVLMNLCVNARDAMPGGGTLTISALKTYLNEKQAEHRPDLAPGWFAGFSIGDTGPGMTDEVKQHLFEPFFTTKADGKGSGIGLATVYAIVKNHGGFIDMVSAPETGTTISVWFPAASGFSVPDNLAGADPAAPGHPHGHGELILLCEDEAQIRSLAQMILEEAGYRVLAAADGEEGMQMFDRQKEAVSLVVLDVIMPKASGRQVFRHIRGLDPTMPVLFTTGYSREMLGGEFGDTVILKPYNEEILLQKVHEILDDVRNGDSRSA